MYWTDLVAGSILRSDLDGSGLEVLVTGLDHPTGIALTAGNRILWADRGTGKIQAANLDGSQVEDIVTGLDQPNAIALEMDRSKIYWRGAGTIQRSDLDGSHLEDIVEVDHRASGLALDVGRERIYWTEDSKVRRSDLDGSNIEDVLTDSDLDHFSNGWPEGNGAIALDPVGARIYWVNFRSAPSIDPIHVPDPSWMITYRSNLDGSNIEPAGGGGDGIALDIPIRLAEFSPYHIATLEGHTGAVTSLSFSPDGTTLASGSWDGIILWDLATRAEVATLGGHWGLVTSLSFSPDGATLASLSGGTIVLWETPERLRPSGLVKVSGDEQRAPTKTQLEHPLVVEILDQNGSVFPGRSSPLRSPLGRGRSRQAPTQPMPMAGSPAR